MAHPVGAGQDDGGGDDVTGDVLQWLFDGANWQGGEGIPLRVWQHVSYSAIAVAIATLIAVPAGLWVGHTGRGRFVAVNLAGVLRAVPSLGLLFASLMILGPRIPGELGAHVPVQVVLVVLAVPPILAGAYAGVEAVDPAARDAARGMGMRGSEVLWRVELPCALPLIGSGLRSAVLQVVATATLAATVGLGGLGRYLIDGLAVRDYAQMAGGALLVAALALLLDLAAATLMRFVVSPGLTGKTGRSSTADDASANSTDPRTEGVLTEGSTR
jgi:osmoprotectant transport system permease protein